MPSWGDKNARLLIVGLAPGLRGANQTGRPFTGDFAGDLLYGALSDLGFAEGKFGARPDDGFTLRDCAVTNAVRCVPPQNKPIGAEINTCRQFLKATIDARSSISAILALGRIAHESLLRAYQLRLKDFAFAHGAVHDLKGGLRLYDSYHCSRYNTNTGRLTEDMFYSVVRKIRDDLATQS